MANEQERTAPSVAPNQRPSPQNQVPLATPCAASGQYTQPMRRRCRSTSYKPRLVLAPPQPLPLPSLPPQRPTRIRLALLARKACCRLMLRECAHMLNHHHQDMKHASGPPRAETCMSQEMHMHRGPDTWRPSFSLVLHHPVCTPKPHLQKKPSYDLQCLACQLVGPPFICPVGVGARPGPALLGLRSAPPPPPTTPSRAHQGGPCG